MSVLSVFVVSCRRRFYRQHQALAIAVALLTTTSVVAAVGHHRRGVPSVLRQTGDDRVGEDGATQPGTTADGDRYAGELAPLGDASDGTRRNGAPSTGPAPERTGNGVGAPKVRRDPPAGPAGSHTGDGRGAAQSPGLPGWSQYHGDAGHDGVAHAGDGPSLERARHLSQDRTLQLRSSEEPRQVNALPAPAIVDGIAYCAQDDGTVVAADVRTWTIRWTASVSGTTVAPAAVGYGLVFVGTRENTVIALRADTGARVWTTPIAPGVITTAPALADGRLYVSSGDRLAALDAHSGRVVWQIEPQSGHDFGVSPTVGGGLVFEGSGGIPGVRAYDATTGEPALIGFTQQGRLQAPLAFADGIAFYGDTSGGLSAVDVVANKPLWHFSADNGVYNTFAGVTGPPAVANGLAYFAMNDGRVFAFEARTGNLRWTTNSTTGLSRGPAYSNGVLYAAGWVLDAMTGEYLADYWHSADPVIAEGYVFVANGPQLWRYG